MINANNNLQQVQLPAVRRPQIDVNPNQEQHARVRNAAAIVIDGSCIGANYVAREAAAQRFPRVPGVVRNEVVNSVVQVARDATQEVAAGVIDNSFGR